MKSAAAVIPARFKSSRFPGKALAPILGRPLIQWVYEGVRRAKLVERVVVATDDQRIFERAKEFGAETVMTSALHRSGTERAAEVAQHLSCSLVINVQGDEPLVTGEMVDALVEALQNFRLPMVSLMAKAYDLELLSDPHIVKVAVDKKGNALYFSRSPVPYQASDFFYQHVGIYGYQKKFLTEFSRLEHSRLEQMEKLEQLRALENGFKIKMVEISHPTLSVDTPQDIIKVEEVLKKRDHG